MASPHALVRALTALPLLGLTWLSAPTSTARACSGPVCPRGEVMPAGGKVPANVMVIHWSKPRTGRELGLTPDSAGQLQRVEGDKLIAVPVTNISPEPTSYLATLVPTEAVPVGTELDFSYPWSCGDETETLHSRLTVTAAAPLPSSLGTLAFALQRGAVSRAGGPACLETTMDAVYADLTVTLASDALPFADVIRYGLEVDGQENVPFVPGDPVQPHAEVRRLGGSPLGRGKDRIYAVCNAEYGLAAVTLGTHRVRMTGLLPDGTKIESDEVEVTLRCATLTDSGTGASAPSDGGTGSDGGAPRPRAEDASVAADGKPGDESSEPKLSAAQDDGCSLTHGHGRRSDAPVFASALLAVSLWLRRRATRAR